MVIARVLHRLRGTPMWMLRGWRRGRGSVDGVEVEGDEVGEKRKGAPVVATVCGGTWRQYRVQARDEAGGRAERMVTPRRAASAGNPHVQV